MSDKKREQELVEKLKKLKEQGNKVVVGLELKDGELNETTKKWGPDFEMGCTAPEIDKNGETKAGVEITYNTNDGLQKVNPKERKKTNVEQAEAEMDVDVKINTKGMMNNNEIIDKDDDGRDM